MKIKSEEGITGIDLTTALIIFIIGSVSVLNLYYQIYTLTVKTKIESTIIGYMTEICEEIDLRNYEDVDTPQDIQSNVIDKAKVPEQYKIKTTVDKYNEDNSEAEDIVERINFLIEYKVGNSNNSYTISKIKVRE